MTKTENKMSAEKKTETKTSKQTGKKHRIKFSIQAEKGSAVYVAGNFNNWSDKKNKLKYKDGIYSTSILLPAGSYEYKFIINDDWCFDPECTDWSANEFGSLNSIKIVG